MNALNKDQWHTRNVALRALVSGFVLVMLLLGAAGFVAVRESRAMRESAAGLVREQVLITRLLHEAQVEEDALALTLHRLTRAVAEDDRTRQLADLNAADQAIARLAESAMSTPQAAQWRELARETRAFSAAVRHVLGTEKNLAQQEMEGLFSRHDQVVKLIHELILKSTEHLSMLDQKLSEQLQDLARESALLLGACLVLSALCAAGTIAYVRAGISHIEWQAEELSRVSWHMLQSQEVTARRFSHELHDELGQSLAALRANLTQSATTREPESLRADSLHLVDEAIANVRELSHLLRPVILDDFGLAAGLRWLAEKFAQRTRLSVDFASDVDERYADETETHLFRIAQEAMTNIARHAQASRVKIRLHREESTALRLVIEDDGLGIAPASAERGPSLGMVGMRARARHCGGHLEVSAAVPHGVRVEAVVPAAKPTAA